MAAICKAAAGPLGLRQAVLAEGTRTLTSPLLGRRRQGATACSWRRSQGRVLAFKDQPEPDPTSEGPVMRGDAKRAADDSGPCATVTFKTCRRVPFGQALKVVGGLPQLGDWDCERAPAMTWTEGDQWLLSVQLPAGHHQFKVVQAQSDAAGYNWEGGPNRELSVPLPEAAAHGAFTVVCEWGNTVSSLETLPEEELEMGVALSDEEDDAPLLRAEDLTAEPYSPNGDEDEAPVGAINMKGRPKVRRKYGTGAAPHAGAAGKKASGGSKPRAAAATAKPPGAGAGAAVPPVAPAPAASAAAATKKPAGKAGGEGAGTEKAGSGEHGGGSGKPASDPHAAVPMAAGDYPSQTPMGVGADDALLGEPAGGLKPSTEAAVKEELQKQAPDPPANHGRFFSRLLQALSGSLGGGKQDKEEDDSDDYGSGGSSGGGGRVSGGAPPPTQQPRSGQQQGSEPPSGLQMAAAAAGLAALPVVGWSEYVLRTTGCGLPPGPGGLLGAAEGVSYLVVGGVVLWSLARKLGTGSGLPAGPAGALGAVEGGSWLAAAAGLGVLVLQWQTFGYIPSALPDANCFGAGAPTAASFSVAQTPGGSVATSQLAPAPALTSSGGIRQAAPAFGAPLRLPAGGPSLPQGNLLFSAAEGVLSQSGTIAQTAETAAAAVAAVLAGQPPPAALAVALQHAQARAVQAQQLASAIVGKLAGDDAQAAQAAELQAPLHTAPQLEPLNLNPPRHKVRALLHSSWAALIASEKLHTLLEPYPLPAVARQAAAAAGGAIEAVEHAAEASLEAVGQDQQRAVALGQSAWSRLLRGGEQAHGVLPPMLRSWLPAADAGQPAVAAVAAAPDPARPAAAAVGSPRPAAAAATPPAAKSPRTGSTAGLAAKAAVAAEASDASKPSPRSSGLSGDMLAGAFADLKEGYVGLWHSALEFDPQRATASLQARVEAQQAAQRTAQAKAAAASTSSVKPAAATSSSSKSAQASSTTSSNVKPSAASTGIMPAAASSATSSNFKPTAASSSVKPAAASTTTPSTAASSTTSTSSGPAVPKTALAPQRPKPAAGTVAAPPAASAP